LTLWPFVRLLSRNRVLRSVITDNPATRGIHNSAGLETSNETNVPSNQATAGTVTMDIEGLYTAMNTLDNVFSGVRGPKVRLNLGPPGSKVRVVAWPSQSFWFCQLETDGIQLKSRRWKSTVVVTGMTDVRV
jgi:hypothetical protein